ncbi:MAG: threonine synthase [Solirubrobacterales bacterium]|nr:threonine synthase [Solirubrobacterales bacterium]
MAPTALNCKECGARYELEARYVCEQCFGPLEVAYDHAGLDPAAARRKIQAGPAGIWRYADFLPFAERPRDALQPGLTPLVRADRLAERLGLREVWIKNDAANPTHSFKDRVVAIALAKAIELGYETVACASTGNLANAVAAHAAAAGLDSYVFVPANLEEQKLLATGVYGTRLVGVEGNYDDVNRLCTQLCETRPWAFVNVNLRPYYSQGSKTLAYEIVEQLGWDLPDRIVCPIASGSLFTKIGRGLDEWLELGLVAGELPAFNGAQALGCSPVAEAYAAGRDVCKPQRPETIAKSLAIGDPADGPYALELARGTGGSIEAVTDNEIRAGIRLLAETTGIFTETAGGVTAAVLAKLARAGAIDPDERVVCVITGEGLKTLDAVRGTFEVAEIEPRFDDFEAPSAGRPRPWARPPERPVTLAGPPRVRFPRSWR